MPLPKREPLASKLTKENVEQVCGVQVEAPLATLLKRLSFQTKRTPTAAEQEHLEETILSNLKIIISSKETINWELQNFQTLSASRLSAEQLMNQVRSIQQQGAATLAKLTATATAVNQPQGGAGGVSRDQFLRESALARTELLDQALTAGGPNNRPAILAAVGKLDREVTEMNFTYKGKTIGDIFRTAGLGGGASGTSPVAAGVPPLPAASLVQPPRVVVPHNPSVVTAPPGRGPLPPPVQNPPIQVPTGGGGASGIIVPNYHQSVVHSSHPQHYPSSSPYHHQGIVPPPQQQQQPPLRVPGHQQTPQQLAQLYNQQYQQQNLMYQQQQQQQQARPNANNNRTSGDDVSFEEYMQRGRRNRSPTLNSISTGTGAGGTVLLKNNRMSDELRGICLGLSVTAAAESSARGADGWGGGKSLTKAKALVGRSSQWERRYSRETPTAYDIRPEHVLKQAFKKIIKKSTSDPDFVAQPRDGQMYLSNQLKGMRQDLKVQGLSSPFAVGVYEYHARLSMQIGESMELMQCQTALKSFYARGLFSEGGPMVAEEFTCYRLIYLAISGEQRLSEELTSLEKASKARFEKEKQQKQQTVGEEETTTKSAPGSRKPTPQVIIDADKEGGDPEEEDCSDDDDEVEIIEGNRNDGKSDACSAYSWFSSSRGASAEEVLQQELKFIPKSSVDCLFYHPKTRVTLQLCAAILAADGLEFNRLLTTHADSALWPETKPLIAQYLQRIRLNWLSRILPGFKAGISMRMLMRYLGLVPLFDNHNLLLQEAKEEEKSSAGKKSKKSSSSSAANSAVASSSLFPLVGPTWIDGSSSNAEEELFKIFQLLKMMQPNKFDFAREVQAAIAQEDFSGPSVDATELKTHINTYFKELNTRKDFR